MILKVALVFNHWGYSGIKVLALFVKQILNVLISLFVGCPEQDFHYFLPSGWFCLVSHPRNAGRCLIYLGSGLSWFLSLPVYLYPVYLPPEW